MESARRARDGIRIPSAQPPPGKLGTEFGSDQQDDRRDVNPDHEHDYGAQRAVHETERRQITDVPGKRQLSRLEEDRREQSTRQGVSPADAQIGKQDVGNLEKKRACGPGE